MILTWYLVTEGPPASVKLFHTEASTKKSSIIFECLAFVHEVGLHFLKMKVKTK